VRRSQDPEWYEYRFKVPLTGREPLLGRLKARLRHKGPGWGWVTLAGPSGAGVSRVLDEVGAMARETGGPPLLRLQPAGDVRLPMAALWRTLRRVFPEPAGPGLERALRSVHAGPGDEIRVLAAWLGARAPQRDTHTISCALVRRFLEHVVPVGPVLVDDLQDIDQATLAVLLPSAPGAGFGVVAGVSGSSPLVNGAQTWELEPLTVGQVELLLRRWLRHSASARRLAPLLTESCGGWPGRVAEAVRRLGRNGCLQARGRGVVVVRAPAHWPDGRRRADGFLEWVRTQDPQARLVLDLAAVQGAPDDLELLADAAGVPTTYLQTFLAEASAARGGLAPEAVFASRSSRRAFLDRLTAARRDEARRRLQDAWARRAVVVPPSDDDAVRRLHLATQGGDAFEIREALDGCLTRLPLTRVAPRWHLDVLARAAEHLPAGDPGAAAVAHRLWHAGQRERARVFLDGAALSAHPGVANLLAQARLHEPRAARAMLADGLRRLEPAVDPLQFDAWAVLATMHLDAGDASLARQAWRWAGAVRDRDDLERAARWHEGLAECATALGRVRASTAHRRRAVRLRLVRSEVHAAGVLLLALGDGFIREGRLRYALEPLDRAAHILELSGDAAASAEAHHLSGRVLTWLEDFDRASERLLAGLSAAEAGRAAQLLPRIHLALAAAFRGCGNLVRERHHAEMAAELATTALGRVQAAAVLARADLRAGVPGADHMLVRCERDLRSAGFTTEADRARAALLDARLRAGDSRSAEALLPVVSPQAVERLAAARLDLAAGRVEQACGALELLGADGRLAADVRAACYTHLADALRLRGRLAEARAAAVAASALLQVTRRSRADDTRMHDALARVFRDVGEHGRAVGHRSAARRGMRSLVRAVEDPREGRRLMRSVWRRDPRPNRKTG